GVYTYDIAATRVVRVHQLARRREFPLKCSLEEA
ncbi:MAG: ATP-dependent Clp protease adaptor ClpS, partial [Candidatus Eisenbacteria bacterium]